MKADDRWDREDWRHFLGVTSFPVWVISLILQPWLKQIKGWFILSFMNVNWDKWLERWMG